MKNLAELKRTIKKGLILELVESRFQHKYLNVKRTVDIVQTNSFALADKDGNKSWVEYPPSKEFKGFDDGFALLDREGKIYLKYKIIS